MHVGMIRAGFEPFRAYGLAADADSCVNLIGEVRISVGEATSTVGFKPSAEWPNRLNNILGGPRFLPARS